MTIVIILLLMFIIYKWPVLVRKTVNQRITSDLDGMKYNIISTYDEDQKASNVMAYLNAFMVKLIRHLRKKYVWRENGEYGRIIAVRLLNKYNPDNLFENIPETKYTTSYIQGKGDKFALCLREKESGENKLHDMHTLEFVTLHEITHIAVQPTGHPTEFWGAFKFLISEANKIGIHAPKNYHLSPIKYCGLDVKYNPFYDQSLPAA
jgi:hypothetical protein